MLIDRPALKDCLKATGGVCGLGTVLDQLFCNYWSQQLGLHDLVCTAINEGKPPGFDDIIKKGMDTITLLIDK